MNIYAFTVSASQKWEKKEKEKKKCRPILMMAWKWSIICIKMVSLSSKKQPLGCGARICG